jgi:hypothetical protein
MYEFFAELLTLLFGAFGWIAEIWGIVWDAIRPAESFKSVEGKASCYFKRLILSLF